MAGFTFKATPWPRNFRPLPNNFGALFQITGEQIGTGSITIVGTATTTIYAPTPAARTFSVTSAGFVGPIAAVGGSTITAQLIRNNAGTPVTLTAATSIKSDVITGDCIDWPITATDQNRTCNPGDTLRWEVVAATTVTTQPTLTGVVELAVLR